MSSLYKKKLAIIHAKVDKLATKGKDQIWEYHKLIDEYINRGDYDNFTQSLYYFYGIDVAKYNGNITDIKNMTWSEILFQTRNSFQKKIRRIYESKEVFQQGYDIYSDSVVQLGLQISEPLSSTYSVTNSTQSVTPNRVGDYIYFTINDTNIYGMEVFKCEWILQDDILQPFLGTTQLFQKFKILATQSSYKTEISIYHGRQYLVRTFSRNNNFQYTLLNYKLDVSRNTVLGQLIEIESFTNDPAYFLQDKILASYQGFKKTYLEVIKTGTASIFVTYENPKLTEEQNLIKRYEAAITYLVS